ncbi:hypothetical protein GCM10011326_44740 [Salipiger profundus]|nr:hypothetical protein GCM10011326_44740 [Salipiger profundus]
MHDKLELRSPRAHENHRDRDDNATGAAKNRDVDSLTSRPREKKHANIKQAAEF